jgi:hypothetical protein
MSFSDTANARKYASIAEVAAAQAKLSADKLENAPDYAEQAAASASAAAASAQVAVSAEGVVNNLAISASESATSAAASAAEAGNAAAAEIGRTVRAPDGELLSNLPGASERQNSVMVFGNDGDSDVKPITEFATLDSNGKIPVSVIPSIALNEPFVVNSEAEMLALDAQVGDIAKRTDLGYSFCLGIMPPSTLANWVQLTDDVLSQLGQSSGAGMVGALDDGGSPSTVQALLTEKANKSSLSSTTGATLIGYGSKTVDQALTDLNGVKDDILADFAASNGITLVGSSVYVANSFASAKSSNPGNSTCIVTKGHTNTGIGSAKYIKDGTTGTASTGDEIKFFDASGNGWSMDLSDAVGIPITRFGLIPGVDTPTQATANAVAMKRGGERTFDVGLRVILPPTKSYIDDVTFSKPVGIMAFTAGLGANQTGVGGGYDGISEWVHRGTGWGIYYEPWLRTNGSFNPDGIFLKGFGFRGNASGGCLGGIKINDDSVIGDESRAKRDVVIEDVTITGCWKGYGLRLIWCFINNFSNLKIWDCAVAYLAVRANQTNHFGFETEGCLQGVTAINTAGFNFYGPMIEYINNSRTYYTMPADYPVDSVWSSSLSNYVGIGLRNRGSKVSVYGGYSEGVPVVFQTEIDSESLVSGVRFQALSDSTNHICRIHGGRSVVFTDNLIEGSVIGTTPFYHTPSMPYAVSHRVITNTYNGTARPVVNPFLGFFGEFDVFRTNNSDAGMIRQTQGISATRSNLGGIADTAGYPVQTGGDVLSSRQVNISATGSAFTCTIGTTVLNAGLVNINVPAGCSLTVALADSTKWDNGSVLTVCIVSSGTSGSPIAVAFSSSFKLATGNDDISAATGKRALFEFKMIGGVFFQQGVAKSV